MDEPEDALKATAEEREERPAFDSLTDPRDLVRGERTRDDFFDAVLGITEPATASEVAERAGHGVDAAREYLDWFERMGIVTQITTSPATYKRNQAYLNWRRIQQLRTEYTAAELVAYLADETAREEAYRESFGVDTPDSVSISAHATTTGKSVEEVWEAVTAWKTTRRRVRLLERALNAETDESPGEQPAI